MKCLFFLILTVFVFSACSVNSHIVKTSEAGLKIIHLDHSYKAGLLTENRAAAGPADLKVHASYYYQEKHQQRPESTLSLKLENQENQLMDSVLIINLEGEDISLHSADGLFIIAENLWIPIVYSHKIKYFISVGNKKMEILLNEKQKDQLIEFFNQAITNRNILYPAIPEGKKKW